MTNMEVDLRGIFEQNDTFYEDLDYEVDCNPESAGHFNLVFIPLLYSLVLVAGVPGNGLVLGILCQKGRQWRVTEIFFFHLVVANILLLMLLPPWAAQIALGHEWNFSTQFNRLTRAIFFISYYCGVFLLVFINFQRYLYLVHNIRIFSDRKWWMVQASCLVIWFLAFLISIPHWISLKQKEDESQSQMLHIHYKLFFQSTHDLRLASHLVHHILGFILPLSVLFYIYICMLTRPSWCSQGLQKPRALKVMLALVVVFFLCWMPYNITLIVNTFQSRTITPDEPHNGSCDKSSVSMETSLVITFALGCLHACLNPLVFLRLCKNIRKQMLEMLRCAKADPMNSLWELSMGEEDLADHPQEKVSLREISIEQQGQSVQG